MFLLFSSLSERRNAKYFRGNISRILRRILIAATICYILVRHVGLKLSFDHFCFLYLILLEFLQLKEADIRKEWLRYTCHNRLSKSFNLLHVISARRVLIPQQQGATLTLTQHRDPTNNKQTTYLYSKDWK